MNDQQSRDWRRWVEAEQAGEDDAADALFTGVFRAARRRSAVEPVHRQHDGCGGGGRGRRRPARPENPLDRVAAGDRRPPS